MTRPGGRLTAQEQRFVTLVVKDGLSFVDAYRLAYPPRNGTRSAGAERVAAKRVAHRPLVQHRMEELREELLASDPEEMRRRALTVLSKIMAKQLDPRYRRTAIDTLRFLDERERVVIKAQREKYRVLVARLTALKTAEAVERSRAQSSSAQQQMKAGPREAATVDPTEERTKHPPKVENAEETARRRAEIERVIEERRRMRQVENFRPRALPATAPRPADPPQAAEEETTVKEDGFQWVRKPGRFGKGGFVRVPVA
jgi:hypothetical protein